MKLGIMQPYFLPYIGYWQLLNAVDTYVIYDDVTFIKGGWINRNNFLINKQKKMFTIRLKKSSSYSLIKEIEILDGFDNFIKMLQANYAKAPYFRQIMGLVRQIIDFDKENLALFITNAIKIIVEYLCINTNLVLSSELEKDKSLKGKDKVISICKLLNAGDYYNSIGGIELYDKNEFADNGIILHFLKTNITPYKQFNNDFIPGLSILDVMMFNSVQDIQDMLSDYTLI